MSRDATSCLQYLCHSVPKLNIEQNADIFQYLVNNQHHIILPLLTITILSKEYINVIFKDQS